MIIRKLFEEAESIFTPNIISQEIHKGKDQFRVN